MKKQLYRKPVRKSKEILFYVCKIGNQKISLLITTEECLYWRIRDGVQELVDSGSLDNFFSKGQVFCQRVARFPKNKLSASEKIDVVKKIKRNFHSISWEELSSAIKNQTSTLEQFMINTTAEDDYCDVEKLKKILPLKEITKEDYYFQAVSARFPEFANKLDKEIKMLADSMEIE
jgi:hypothetical protein